MIGKTLPSREDEDLARHFVKVTRKEGNMHPASGSVCDPGG
jgi:hypothetical protein